MIVMLGLSLWQFERLEWKTDLIDERRERLASQPVALPSIGAGLSGQEFRRTTLAGTFRHDLELLLGARSLHGNVGYQLVTPLELPGDGGWVLINRGWIPMERKNAGTRKPGQVEGMVSLEGIIRLPQRRAWMQPENEPDRRVWFYLDVAAMAKAAGVAAREDLYVEAGPGTNPGGLPVGGQARIDLPNDHLQYAITWALLAMALVVVYVVFHLKLEREGKGSA